MKVEVGIGVSVLVAEAVGERPIVADAVAVKGLAASAGSVFVATGGGAIISTAVGGKFAIKVAETSVSTEAGIPFVVAAVGGVRVWRLQADRSSIRMELATMTRWFGCIILVLLNCIISRNARFPSAGLIQRIDVKGA